MTKLLEGSALASLHPVTIMKKVITDLLENDLPLPNSWILKAYQKYKGYRSPQYDLWNTLWGIIIMLNLLASGERITIFSVPKVISLFIVIMMHAHTLSHLVLF